MTGSEATGSPLLGLAPAGPAAMEGRLLIVKPETVVGWHRAGFRLYWRWRSQRGGGRPEVAEEMLGIVIRKVSMPGPNSPSLLRQLLLGLPVSLVIVSPTLALFRLAHETDLGAYLLAVGIIIEHGMLVQETATRHLQTLTESCDASQYAASIKLHSLNDVK
jgi:hypothetical protein